jgi:predicted acetyltransferase
MQHITILPAQPADMAIWLNLSKFYIYEMSKSTGWECNPDGTFDSGGYDREYWQPQHPETAANKKWPRGRTGHPFIVRAPTAIVGFALIQEKGDDDTVDYDMGEFFILGKYQGLGIGQHVAHQLFGQFRGRWIIRQILSNRPAQNFWRRTVTKYTGGDFVEDTIIAGPSDGPYKMICQRFDSSKIGPSR